MLQSVTQTLEIPVRNECDILVVGAGPAGMGAALTAARMGARVTLVEYGGKLGGMWTLGLLSPFFDNWNKPGLNQELREKLAERHAWGGLWDMSFDPSQMALLLNQMALDAKLDVLLYTTACEPYMQDNTIKGVFVQNKSGKQLILAKVVIDCTGDGDIAARAGCPFEVGRPSDGAFQPMTMMFKIGGLREEYPRDATIDWYALLQYRQRESQQKLIEDVPFDKPCIIKLPGPGGQALVQWTHIRFLKGTDGEEFTRASQQAMLQVEKAMLYFREVRDLLGEVYLLELPAVIGVRESRRIKGEYQITDDDVLKGFHPVDGICDVHFGVDIHEPSKAEQTNIRNAGFDIPFRSLVPLGVENLLTAGRCISGSFVAHASYRVTGDCLMMGEAAGAKACDAKLAKVKVANTPSLQPFFFFKPNIGTPVS